MQALLEKAKMAMVDDKGLEERLEEGKFTLTELYDQLKAMRKMGPLNKLTQLIPGFSNVKLPENLLEVQEDKLKRWGYVIESMTPHEKENPDVIDSSRIARISKGSFVPSSEIRELLKQYKLVKKFFGVSKGKGLSQKDIAKLAKKFKLPALK